MKRKLSIKERIDFLGDRIDDLYEKINNKSRELNSLMEEVFFILQQICDLSYEMMTITELQELDGKKNG